MTNNKDLNYLSIVFIEPITLVETFNVHGLLVDATLLATCTEELLFLELIIVPNQG